MVRVRRHTFSGIYLITLDNGTQKLATKNLVPGRNVYGEKLLRVRNSEYRVWDPFRSKLSAAIKKGLKMVPILPGHKILYLGAASGTTSSHVSDIIGEKGCIYCIEFAHRPFQALINNVCLFRSNMSPIMADARFPTEYLFFLDKVDVIYCDIAQPEQAKVLADNSDLFLQSEGWVILVIKARSIDVTKDSREVFEQEINVLRNRGFYVEDVVELEPYDKAHAMVIAKKN